MLLILVDDLRPALGAYGDPTARTPRLDRLAAESVLFERAYVHQAICAPSRMHLLSGLRPETVRLDNLDTLFVERFPDHVTLPQHFRQNGYQTVSVGKVYHHAADDPAGWTRRINPEGRWEGRGYLTAAAQARAQTDERGIGPPTEAAAVADTAYEDGKVAEAAVAELRQFAATGRPFFLAVGLRKPHLPFSCPERYWAVHPPETVRLPENGAPPRDSVSYALSETLQEIDNYTGVPRDPPMPTPLALDLIRGYRACVSYADALVGRVLDALEAEGLAENTVVVVWGDHGYKLGDHGAWAKHTTFEIDTRVPLIVRAPGVAPARTRALVETVDVFASLAELAGLPPPRRHEGTSFAPLLRDPDRPWKRAVFSRYPRFRLDPDQLVMGRSVRTDRWRYAEWRHRASGAFRGAELYDHDADPEETVNLARDPAYADVVAEMAAVLRAGPRAALPPPTPATR